MLKEDFQRCKSESKPVLLINPIKQNRAIALLNGSRIGAMAGIPLRQLAASMGHDVRTHMKHYGQWTDEDGLDAAFGAANARITARLREGQCHKT